MNDLLQPNDLSEEARIMYDRIVEHRTANIVGYRNLTAEEIELVNEVKRKAEDVSDLLRRVGVSGLCDPRWLGAGTLDIQKGFMEVVRSITRPTSF